MKKWLDHLDFDPIKPLLDSDNEAVKYFVKRDLLEEKIDPITHIWKISKVQKVLKKQLEDGSWKHTGKKIDMYPPYHYSLAATFKIFRQLVERYEMNKSHEGCKKAAEFLFTCQSEKGDIRGMIGNQYATYYTGYMTSLLIKAGYKDDKRVKKALEWLLDYRQNDGGWTIPILTHSFDKGEGYMLTSEKVDPVEPDKTKPFSHNWTNMVLQGFSAHPDYNNNPEIKKAGELLKSMFFQKDFYGSYKSEYYWIRFGFWWPNLLSALESLYNIGFSKDDEDISLALKWFLTHQRKDGLWNIENKPGKKPHDSPLEQERRLWLSLRIQRMLKKYLE